MAQIVDVGIDLGTASVVICGRDSGVILNEPAVVAVERGRRTVTAIGTEAYRMIGRTPGNIAAVRPLRDGTVSDFDLVSEMLSYFVRKACGKHLFGGPQAVITLPSGINDMESHSLISCLFNAGVRRTRILPKPIAAALGASMKIGEAYGQMVVDIGAGLTDMAVTSVGKIVTGKSTDCAGDCFDDAIIRYIRRKHNLLIGEITAEEIKRDLASALPRGERLYMEITGRNLITGLPRVMRVSSDEAGEAVEDAVLDLIENIHAVLEYTPAELAADILDNGIILTGGGAQLDGLPERIGEALKVNCRLADDPQLCAAKGCLLAVENRKEYARYFTERRRRG